MPDNKPSIEDERKLNPPMQVVVLKEIIKWLDIGVIYTITNGSWVYHVQCVTKKGCINGVSNVRKEYVPMQSLTG